MKGRVELFAEESEAAAKKKGPRPLRPSGCRRYARKKVAEAFDGILTKFTEEAKKGSVPHAKELLRISGLDKEEPVRRGAQKPPRSFAQLLMEELERDGDAAPKPDERQGE